MWLIRAGVGALLMLGLLAPQAAAQSAPEVSTLRAIQSQVSHIRGLAPQYQPELRLLDHASLHAYLVDEFNRTYLASERAADQQEMVALGFLRPDQDVVQLQLRLLDDQVVGIYDTDARALFVVSDQDAFGPAARITYAHEFNHALQDQNFDLQKLAPRHPDSNDRSLAVHALIEGDAILLQTLWAVANLSQAEIAALIRGSGDSGTDALAESPPLLRTELLFPYVDGLNFVRQAYRDGGNSYAAVDAIFRDPPESTAQILHPDKYRRHVHPVRVLLPDVATTIGADWRRVGAGVLGELDTRVLLEQGGLSQAEASRIASHWSGDGWQLVDTGSGGAIALESTWETPDAAAEFFSAYSKTLLTRFPAAEVEEASDVRQALSTAATATDVTVNGSTVLVVIAPDRGSADALVQTVTAASVP
jgi:hypothetical protein